MSRIQGWWWLNPYIHQINDEFTCQVGENLAGQIRHLRIYDRYLRTCEAVANFHAGYPR